MLISLIRRYRYIKALDRLIFPREPITIKIVWKGRKPTGYWNVQRGKLTKEWYEIVIITKTGNDFNEAVHEVRHRIQCHYPKMPLFTKNKLIEMQRRNPQQVIQKAIDDLEAIEKKEQEPLPEWEEDAIIVAKIVEQKCRSLRNPLEIAGEWIKKTP